MIGRIVYSSVYRGLSYLDDTGKTFLYLNGQSVSRASYPDLSTYFDVGAFGSDASFIHLPNVTHLCWRGLDLGRGADVARSSRAALSGISPTGDNLGAFQPGEIRSHTHVSGTVVPGNFYYFRDGSGGTISVQAGTVTSNTTPLFINPSGIIASGTAGASFHVGAMGYFPYLGAD
jgi:hypothetical protein